MPLGIAIEQQAWMEERALASLWLPASPPGMCKQCALGERTCVQVRTKLMVGQPPPNKPSTPGAKGGGGGSGGTPGGHQAPVRDDVEQELLRELLPEPQEWDFM